MKIRLVGPDQYVGRQVWSRNARCPSPFGCYRMMPVGARVGLPAGVDRLAMRGDEDSAGGARPLKSDSAGCEAAVHLTRLPFATPTGPTR